MGQPRNYPRFPTRPGNLSPEGKTMWDTLERWWGRVAIEIADSDAAQIEGAASYDRWVVSLASATYDYDAGTAVDGYTAQRLATLLSDLKEKGIVK
jgi:hypothetical protein